MTAKQPSISLTRKALQLFGSKDKWGCTVRVAGVRLEDGYAVHQAYHLIDKGRIYGFIKSGSNRVYVSIEIATRKSTTTWGDFQLGPDADFRDPRCAKFMDGS